MAHRYAKEYARVQRFFNGGKPDEILANVFLGETHGNVPYWDVDSDASSHYILGMENPSPFVTSDGKTRIFNHYLNKKSTEALIEKYGEPTGEIKAEMTSSYRTLILFPKDDIPYMLKFSGTEFYSRINSNVGERKKLDGEQVRGAVENSLHLRKSPFITPEPAGLVLSLIHI